MNNSRYVPCVELTASWLFEFIYSPFKNPKNFQ